MSRISQVIVGATVVVLGTIGIGIWQTLATAGYGLLDLSVAPADATVQIDGHGAGKPGKIELPPGTHTVQVSRKGYDSETVSVVVSGGSTTTKGIIMTAIGKEAGDASKLTDTQRSEAEGQAGKIIDQEGAKVTASNPLISKLPYYGPDYNIDVGKSQKYANDPSAVAIYITPLNAAAKIHALDWIKANGFDPNAYEIIYSTDHD
jgi:hypothetical protein